MDPFTHAASGALLALSLPKKPSTRWFLPLAAAIAAAPDLDIIFCHTPELFLLLHRGISHSLTFLPFWAFLASICCWPLWKVSTSSHFSIFSTWLFCSLLLLTHLWLDCITTYGTMIFLPFSNFRVRFNATFIVDIFLTLPLIALVVIALSKKGIRRISAIIGLCWLFLYPTGAILLNNFHEASFRTALQNAGLQVTNLTILPDFFAPVYWRAVYTQKKDNIDLVLEQSLDILGHPRGPTKKYLALTPDISTHLSAQSNACANFLHFLIQPIHIGLETDTLQNDLIYQHEMEKRNGHLRAVLIHDLRFGSSLVFGQKILANRPNAAIPFRLLLLLDDEDTIVKERFIFSDSHMDTGWNSPSVPEPTTFLDWICGFQ